MDYQSYLLRIWRDPASEEDDWRIVLQAVQSAEKHNINTLEELAPCLRKLLGESKTKGKPS